MEEKDIVKKYLDILKDTGMENMAITARRVFRRMDSLRNNLSMASVDLDYVKKGTDTLADEAKGKGHAQQALSAALKGITAALDYYSQAETIIVNGVADSVKWFRGGRDNALEKPFPIQAVEQRMEGMKECLRDAFIAVDLGIGRTEEAEGAFCEKGYYWRVEDNVLWEDSGENPGLLDVLWPMRSLEQVIGQAYEAAHDTFVYADCLRPKGHAKYSWDSLREGRFWMEEKEKVHKEAGLREKLPGEEKEEETAKEKPAAVRKNRSPAQKGKQGEKPSLRKRLKVAESDSRQRYSPMPVADRGDKAGEAQR